MIEAKLSASDGLVKIDFVFDVEIGALTFEELVFLDLEFDDNVAWLDSGLEESYTDEVGSYVFVGLSGEGEAVAFRHALVYFDVQYLNILNDALGIALLALVLDYLAAASAIIARRNRLSHHEAHTYDLGHFADASAGRACFD